MAQHVPVQNMKRSHEVEEEEEKESEDEIIKWLKYSYQVSSVVTVSRDKLHQKCADFCAGKGLADIGKRSLDSLIKRTFPSMKVKRNQNARKMHYHYGYGLEQIPPHVANTSKMHSEVSDDLVPQGDLEQRQDDVERRQTSHQSTADWLSRNFEINPAICLLRGTVYNCYAEFCKSEGLCPVIPAQFGKISQKTFPRITVRRLGQRGKSRYFCMGIDILKTSAHYRDISIGRVQIPDAKPKLSRSFNGVRRNSPRVK